MPQVRAQAVSKLNSISGGTLKGRLLHVLQRLKIAQLWFSCFARPLLTAIVEGVLFVKVSYNFA